VTFSSRSSNDAEAACLALLPDVIVEVAEHAFFAWAEACDVTKFAEVTAAAQSPDATEPWLHARVAFDGVVAGVLEVLLPRDLARDLGTALIGVDGSDWFTDEQVEDVAGELANMVCGVLLTRTGRDRRFELRPPSLSRSPAAQAAATASDRDVLFIVNDQPIIVRMSVWDA